MISKNEDFTSDDLIKAWEETKEKFLEESEQRNDSEIHFIIKELLDDEILRPRKKSLEEYYKDNK